MITSALESGSPLPFNPYINCARKGECDLEYVLAPCATSFFEELEQIPERTNF